MSDAHSDAATAIAAIIAVVAIVGIACATGHDDTLVKLGIAAVAGLGGFTLRQAFRRSP
jgi:hypothetical protein